MLWPLPLASVLLQWCPSQASHLTSPQHPCSQMGQVVWHQQVTCLVSHLYSSTPSQEAPRGHLMRGRQALPLVKAVLQRVRMRMMLNWQS